jgi:hypothetical protein
MSTRRILGYKPYSANPQDDYLEVVLCEVTHGTAPNQRIEYVTWENNKADETQGHDGTFAGHYFTDLNAAIIDFNKRGVVDDGLDGKSSVE